LTEHKDVITPLLREAPRLGFALGPALARAGPGYWYLGRARFLTYCQISDMEKYKSSTQSEYTAYQQLHTVM